MNRLLGTLFAIATIVAIVFAILNAGSYTSICATTEPTPVDSVAVESTVVVDKEPVVEGAPTDEASDNSK